MGFRVREAEGEGKGWASVEVVGSAPWWAQLALAVQRQEARPLGHHLLCPLFILTPRETLQLKQPCSPVTPGPCLVLCLPAPLLSEAIHVGVCSSRGDEPAGSGHSPASPLARHMALDKQLNCSVPQFPPMQNGGDNRNTNLWGYYED